MREQLRYSVSGTLWGALRPLQPDGDDRPDGQDWALACDEMLACDPKLSSAAMQLCNNLLDASWTIKEGSAGDWESRRNAEFCREALGLDGAPCKLASGSFESEIRPLVRFPLIGFHVAEELWRVDGDGLYWLDGYGDIDTASIWAWKRDYQGRLTHIEQLVPVIGTRRYMPIPAEKCLVMTHNKTGDDYLGVGLLAPCWGWYKIKKALEESLEVGVKRLSVPVLMLRPDRQSLQDEGYSLDEQTTMLQTAQEFAQKWTDGQADALVAPAGIDPSVFGNGAFNPASVIEGIRHANEEMAAAFLSNFSELGLNEQGTRSIGEIHWNSYRSSIANYLDEMADAINGPSRPGGGTLAKLLELNFYSGPVPSDVLPKIAHIGAQVNAIRDMSSILPQLVASGLVTPTDEIERAILRELRVGMPSITREWRERLREVGSVQLPDSQGGRPREDAI